MSDVTAKWAIPFLEGTDIGNTIDATDQAKAELLDDLVTPFDAGARSSRPRSTAPVPGIVGRTYRSPDGGVDLDLGTSWTTSKPGLFTALPTVSGHASDGLDEGMEIYLQTAAMATALVPPYHLRYDSTLSGTSKWAAISASAWVTRSGSTSAAFTNAWTYEDGGPHTDIVLPAPGSYLIRLGAQLNPPASRVLRVAPVATGLAAADANAIECPAGATPGSTLSTELVATGISGTLVLHYWTTHTGGTFDRRYLSVTPLRIG